MRLTDYIGDDDFIMINGIKYTLDFTFDTILRVYEMAQDKSIEDFAMIESMFNNLVVDCDLDLDLQEKSDIVDAILNEKLAKETIKDQNEGQEEGQEENLETENRTHDFVQDAELIYASFLRDYRMDLFKQQGKLHWTKFIALLNNLSDDSPFKKVVHIRVKKLPKQTKYNKEEIANLKRLKRYYSLDGEKSPDERIDKALTTLGSAFMGAKKGGNT